MASSPVAASKSRIQLLAPFVDNISYYAMNFDDDAGYDGLKKLLESIDKKSGTKGNRLFYLATAPEYFADIINSLGKHKMNKPAGGQVRELGSDHHREALRPRS